MTTKSIVGPMTIKKHGDKWIAVDAMGIIIKQGTVPHRMAIEIKREHLVDVMIEA